MVTVRLMPDACTIAVFARAPVAGQTKTRLIPHLGAEGAASLHAALIRHCLTTARAAAIGPVELWGVDIAHPFLAGVAAEFGATLRPQRGVDLGARMLACFEAQAGRPCLLVGTDAPIISPEDFRACADALKSVDDAVFLPAEDGGYALVGLRDPIPSIFQGMRWSESDVMAITRERLRAAGLRWREPRLIWDVDRPPDVDRLAVSGLLPDFDFTCADFSGPDD